MHRTPAHTKECDHAEGARRGMWSCRSKKEAGNAIFYILSTMLNKIFNSRQKLVFSLHGNTFNFIGINGDSAASGACNILLRLKSNVTWRLSADPDPDLAPSGPPTDISIIGPLLISNRTTLNS
jgi:hypothetical protein